MSDISDIFEKETGHKAFIWPTCHADRQFFSDEYGLWLEDQLYWDR